MYMIDHAVDVYFQLKTHILIDSPNSRVFRPVPEFFAELQTRYGATKTKKPA